MKDLPIGFLLSNWWSGATLLSLLVDRHPQIVTNGEGFYQPNPPEDTMCSCGTSVRNCPFYRNAAAAMWDQFDFDKELFAVTPHFIKHRQLNRILSSTIAPGKWRRNVIHALPASRAAYANFLHHHVEFMRNAIAITGASIYFDGTKSIRRAELFLSENEYRSSPIVLLVRDPCSWCAAWLQRGSKGPKVSGINRAIRTWIEYVRRSFLLSRRFPSAPFMVIRFEDLCAHPEAMLGELEDFLGLPHMIYDLSQSKAFRPEEHHVLGNKMRLSFDGTIRRARDRSDELSETEKTLVLDRCASWMKKLGYRAP